ncbi:MAG: hypothetical protein ACRYG7_37455 [Janthinobacterium lividum]
MKTYTLAVLEAANEDLVADILTALQKQRLIEYVEAPTTSHPAFLNQAEIEQDILIARQQPSISLSEARAQFGV